MACGDNFNGQCSIPCLDEKASYTQVSAGLCHSVLLLSDGKVVACGSNDFKRCNIPALPEGLSYMQVSAGGAHTVCLRSDGSVVACGMNDDGECNIPSLWSWSSILRFAKRPYYIANPLGKDRLLQLVIRRDTDALVLTCHTLAGQEVLLLQLQGLELASDLRVVLLDGELLSNMWQANPAITVADLSQIQNL